MNATCKQPVKLFAQLAIASARAIDTLFNGKPHDTGARSPPNEKERSNESTRCRARPRFTVSPIALEKRLPAMVAFKPMGEANYNDYLKHVLLLPLTRSRWICSGEQNWPDTARSNHFYRIPHWPIPTRPEARTFHRIRLRS